MRRNDNWWDESPHSATTGDVPARTSTVGIPAVGTASVTQGTTAAYVPATTAETIVALINDVCTLYARAEVARAMAGNSATDEEHATHCAHADRWDSLVNDRYAALVDAVHAAMPCAARPERFIPVRLLNNGRVELHLHDATLRRFAVLLTGSQAISVGTHLIGYGSVGIDRTGQKVDAALPHLKAGVPLVTEPGAHQPTGPAAPPPTRT
jgi:hypothetical protein